MIRIESINVMELCENCTIAVDDNNIYYVNKFCNDCFKMIKNWTKWRRSIGFTTHKRWVRHNNNFYLLNK